MERALYLLSVLAIFFISSSSGALHDVDLGTGTGQLVDYHGGLGEDDDIDKLHLACPNDKTVRISRMMVHKCNKIFPGGSPTANVKCGWEDSEAGQCEGVPGRCFIQIYKPQFHPVYNIYEVNITFQCIPSSQIYEVCSTMTPVPSTYSFQIYLTTPKFDSPKESYNNNSDCYCIATSTSAVKLTIEFLYLELDSNSILPNRHCLDYFTFGSSATKYCKFSLKNVPVWQTSAVTSMKVRFISNRSRARRGAWFAVYPVSQNETVNISCDGYHTTTQSMESSTQSREQTTSQQTQPTTKGNLSQQQIATLIGSVVGGVCALCIVLTVIACVLVRRAAARRSVGQQRQQNALEVNRQQESVGYEKLHRG